ncbi:MAG: hypothetical protein KKI02_01625 [Planctomycetes bacterium]|nr:hypothetical protein [Planctomycetota bacterium]
MMGGAAAEEPIAGTATEWAGVTWVMLPWPLPEEKRERLHMLVHEMFHRVQPKLGLSAGNTANRHLDTRDGRVWLQLEWRALQAALQASDLKRRQAVADALTFRAYRRSVFPEAAREERAMEALEGLAEYTGVRLSADSEQGAITRALKNFELAKSWPTYTGSFAYVSGAAYGLLLDDAKPDWRKGLAGEVDFGDLLANALGIALPRDLKAAAAERSAAYDAEQLIAAETERETAGLRRLARHRERFVTGPVLIIPIHSMQFQFDPRDIQPLDDLGRVYPKMKMSDAWGILKMDSGGALIAADWSKVTVPAPGDTNARPLTGDGWTLELNEGWRLVPGKRAGDYIVERSSDEPKKAQESLEAPKKTEGEAPGETP